MTGSTAKSLSRKRCWPVIRQSCARICSCTCASPDDHFAIAERLSHFLTNSKPDAHLLAGNLTDPSVLRRETDRLIDSAGFDRFVKSFAAYWLNLRHLRRDDPDKRLYPEYQLDEYLVDSLERETLAFLTAMLRENLPIRNLVQADFLFVNERLARHYDLEPVYGAAMRRVAVPKGSPLGGLLTQGAILKITANGVSTSPVLRGAWIMDRILGEPPPPPPPGVPAVEPDIRGAQTIRDQLAMHTRSSTCASCHAKFDPVGLALENFDVLGRWRTHYRGTAEGERVTGIDHTGHDFAYTIAGAVDASGALADGRRFRDVRDLKTILAGNDRQLARNSPASTYGLRHRNAGALLGSPGDREDARFVRGQWISQPRSRPRAGPQQSFPGRTEVMNAPHIAARPMPRRSFLRAAGVSLALPMLDCMTPLFGQKAAAPPRRMLIIANNLGVLPKYFFPQRARERLRIIAVSDGACRVPR